MTETTGAAIAVGSIAAPPDLSDVIGALPYRLALAGGWIDQPFVSVHNPEPPGSMVVVSLQPSVPFMDRSGMATGTRAAAERLWAGALPAGDPISLARDLYEAENARLADPSGSQDMLGLILPGISRLDYDVAVNGGIFPCATESTCDPAVVGWLERVIHLIAVGPRPRGYQPLGTRHLDPEWIRRLARSGRACYEAILRRDVAALGASMVECTCAWEAILPDTLSHPTIQTDLRALLAHYQRAYAGAMYSGCGGGYLVVASEDAVPGSFAISIRTE